MKIKGKKVYLFGPHYIYHKLKVTINIKKVFLKKEKN